MIGGTVVNKNQKQLILDIASSVAVFVGIVLVAIGLGNLLELAWLHRISIGVSISGVIAVFTYIRRLRLAPMRPVDPELPQGSKTAMQSFTVLEADEIEWQDQDEPPTVPRCLAVAA